MLNQLMVHGLFSLGGLVGGFAGAWLGVRYAAARRPFPVLAALLEE